MTRFTAHQTKMLMAPFAASTEQQLVGVEIEAALVDPSTGKSRRYSGERGVGEFLRRACRYFDGDPCREMDKIIGFKRSDGTTIELESGCAIEYGSTPEPSLYELVQKSNRDLHSLVNIADDLNLALLSGAMLPFDTKDEVHWAPKPRIPFMLEHFQREIGATSQGWAAMAHIITVQTTLDFTDAADLTRKYRMANVVSPFVAALFVNSPIQSHSLTGVHSRRMQIWAEVDSRRVGIFEHSIADDVNVNDVVSWTAQLPMIYRVVNKEIRAAPPHKSFQSLLHEGFGDGTFPTRDDWAALLNTSWPYVRLRNTIELRIADGLSHRHWAAAPALWLGLAYDPQSCDDAWKLARGHSLKTYLDSIDDVAVRGLEASFDGKPIRAKCTELLNIAQDGLSRRVKEGLEPETILTYLDPLFDVVKSNRTFAERLSEQWSNEWAFDPRRYVDEYRYL